jgi:hypothetical protein
MIAIILIAIAAGAASALMFASTVSGALVSILLYLLAPLPLLVAALGWGPLCATIGGIAAASVLGAIFGLPHGIAFAITVGLPAWWLGHLVLLGRPTDGEASSGNGASPIASDLEWYPIGRILLWISGFAALTTSAALLSFGSDAESITGALRQLFLQITGPDIAGKPGDSEELINALVAIAPAPAAVFATATLTINLWLAAKITATSGRLHRPWPELKNAALPQMTLAALCVAIAFCFAGGLVAILAVVVTGALMMAYTLIGFAVLHTLTLALRARRLWLGCAYAIVVVFIWPVLAMVALGLADVIFGIRRRYLRSRLPPPLPAS